MSLRGDAIRQAGANKAVRPEIRLSKEKPSKGKEKAMLLTDPFVLIALGFDLYDLRAVKVHLFRRER